MRRTTTIVLLLVLAIALSGCTRGLTAAEQKAKCFRNETLVRSEMELFKADSGLDAPLQTVIEKTHVVCPNGGTYSYDAATGIVTCSVHGHK